MPILRMLLLCCLCAASAAAETLVIDGQERHFDLVVPSDASGPVPLLILLHGGGGDPEGIASGSGFADLAQTSGFAVAFPAGYGGHWNDGREDFDSAAHTQAIDDVGFLTGLVTNLTRSGVADPAKVYLAGISNGGMMTLRMLCEKAELFAGFAVVVASLPESLAATCQPARAVPLLVMNGTADPLVAFEGGAVGRRKNNPRGFVMGTEAMLAILAAHFNCKGRSEVAFRDAAPDDEVTPHVFAYEGCEAPIRFYRLDGAGHGWPGADRRQPRFVVGKVPDAPKATDEIWQFLSTQPSAP